MRTFSKSNAIHCCLEERDQPWSKISAMISHVLAKAKQQAVHDPLFCFSHQQSTSILLYCYYTESKQFVWTSKGQKNRHKEKEKKRKKKRRKKTLPQILLSLPSLPWLQGQESIFGRCHDSLSLSSLSNFFLYLSLSNWHERGDERIKVHANMHKIEIKVVSFSS